MMKHAQCNFVGIHLVRSMIFLSVNNIWILVGVNRFDSAIYESSRHVGWGQKAKENVAFVFSFIKRICQFVWAYDERLITTS